MFGQCKMQAHKAQRGERGSQREKKKILFIFGCPGSLLVQGLLIVVGSLIAGEKQGL